MGGCLIRIFLALNRNIENASGPISGMSRGPCLPSTFLFFIWTCEIDHCLLSLPCHAVAEW